VCGLGLSAQDAGDGPAVFVILFLGLIVVALAALVEIKLSPPIWVHLVLWTPFIIVGAIAMLRPLKAGLIALQYRHHLLVAPPPSCSSACAHAVLAHEFSAAAVASGVL